MSGPTPQGHSDLPADLQAELREFAAHDAELTHYGILGVPVDSEPAAIRRAYLEKSRRYHPDTYYGKQLGEYGPVLSRAFQRLSRAYQILADEKARTNYDQEHGDLFSYDEHAKVRARLTAEADEQRRSKERRERLLRMKGFARLGAARQLYEHAMQLAAEGKRLEAIASLSCARELDPQRKEIAGRLAELEKEQAKARAGSALALARDQEEAGEKAKAQSMYAAALQLDPRSADAAVGGARCAAANKDQNQLLTFALKACELAPNNMEAHLLAARAFHALKQKPRAKAELELVLKREPQNAEARALLRQL